MASIDTTATDVALPVMSSEATVIERTARPATAASLTGDLRELGLGPGDVVITHASLSRLGWVAGGAQAVVEALLAAVGPTGTVVMPAQTGQLSDPANWVDPPVPADWIDDVRAGLPAFDRAITPTRGMGHVAECFRGHADAERSSHPLVSFVAVGPLADEIVGHHPLAPALGDESPLGRLYDRDATVLLLGVDHGDNTSLHLAEHRSTWDGRADVVEGAPISSDGERRWIEFSDLDRDDSDFACVGDAFAAAGSERRGTVGAGPGRLCRQREIVDFAVPWFTANRPGSLDT